MFDLKITGGTVVDGTGADRFTGRRGSQGRQDRRDASPRARRPAAGGQRGRDDRRDGQGRRAGVRRHPHHYDGQVSWDSVLEPSSNHGVTTVVAGNCGVGFAPVRPGSEEWLIALMEGVEDIPGTALTEGMTWGWESYAEYLDVIGKRELAVDFGSQIAHGTVRAYAMGERGARNEPATPEDIAAMSPAGAGGGRGRRARLLDVAHDRPPCDGRRARARHLRRRGRAVRPRPGHGGRRAGVFELAPQGAAGEDIIAPKKELEWMQRLGAEIDRRHLASR